MAGLSKFKLKKYLLSGDNLAAPFGLKFRGEDKHRTIFGALCTLLGGIVVLAYFLWLIVSYGKYELIGVSVFRKRWTTKGGAEEYGLMENKLLPRVGATYSTYDSNGDQVTKDSGEDIFKIFTPGIAITNFVEINGQKTSKLNFYPYEVCKDDPKYTCPTEEATKLAKLTFYSPAANLPEVRLVVYPCSLSAGCDSFGLKDAVLNYKFTERQDVDTEVVENPVFTYEGTSEEVRNKDYYTSQEHLYKVEPVEVFDINGFPRKDRFSGKVLSIQSITRTTGTRNPLNSVTACDMPFDPSTCQHFARLSFEQSQFYTRHDRTFKSLIDVLSQTGGIFSIVMLVIGIFYGLANRGSEEAYIVEKVYGIKRRPQSLRYYLCCHKKKYEDQGVIEASDRNAYVSSEVFDKAAARVSNNLDLVTIAKELDCIKFIIHYLMEDYQRRLVTLAALQHDLSEGDKVQVKDSSPTEGQNLVNNPEETSEDDDFSLDNRDAKDAPQAVKELGDRFSIEHIDQITPEILRTLGFREELRIDLDKKLRQAFMNNNKLPKVTDWFKERDIERRLVIKTLRLH